MPSSRGFPVDIVPVITLDVERSKRLSRATGAPLQERVEKLLPGSGVHGRGLGDDAVQIKHGRIERTGVDVNSDRGSLRHDGPSIRQLGSEDDPLTGHL